jgi:hypothetical protein
MAALLTSCAPVDAMAFNNDILNEMVAAKLSEVCAEATRINLGGGNVTLLIRGDQVLLTSSSPYIDQTFFLRHSEPIDLIAHIDSWLFMLQRKTL